MKKIFYTILFAGVCAKGSTQIRDVSAGFFIGSGAVVTVVGDVVSNEDFTGTGLLLLKGSALQNLDMGGFTIPNLELDNSTDATMINTDTRIGNNFKFTNGKFQIGNLNCILGPAATTTGASNLRFFLINGTGQLVKELTADIAGFELPVGETVNYRPAYLTASGNTYSSAKFGIKVLGASDPNLPPRLTSYLTTNWPVTKTGITNGSVSLSGQYLDPTDVSGVEAQLYGYYYNGADWSSNGETHNNAINQVGMSVLTPSGVVTGFNKFVAVGAKVFLQGAYSSATGLMTDNLRTLPFGTSASTANFPSTDPYRVAPYNTAYTHTANSEVETIANSSVIGAQIIPGNNIVDWVFLELRNLNASPGNIVLQSRSALLQRDGDIVDIDGTSPVTFNNIPDGDYIIAVRHRNHLGLSFDQAHPVHFTETKTLAYSPANIADFTTATDAQIYGTTTAFTQSTHPTLGTVTLLWGGDVNANRQTRYQGPSNDRLVLVSDLGNTEINILSGYLRGDVNMNKSMRYQGPSNDRVFLLTILSSTEVTLRAQQLPN
jgi:hypothetical protein